MSDLAQLLRGYRIDARQPEEVMRQAAAELDRLNAQALELCAEISGLRRENERLRSNAEAMRHDLGVLRGYHHEGCMAEIERLRVALRQIADDPAVRSHPDSVRVAREALGEADQPSACQHAWSTVPMPTGEAVCWKCGDLLISRGATSPTDGAV